MKLARVLNERMTEAELQESVIELARMTGWRVHHSRPARTAKGWRTPIEGDAGLPDLVLVKPPAVIFAELKSERGKTSPDQRGWLDALSRCPGVEAVVWRPSSWADIQRRLTA